jgi:ABC-type dipeptide/oligopeptide/nickel transport system permease component
MLRFLTKRFIGLLFVILGVTFISFIMGYFAPGNPIQVLMGDHPNPVLEAQLKHLYGLDLPWYEQYFRFLLNLVKLNFGTSFYYQGRSVADILKDGVPISLELGMWGIFLQVIIGIPVGIISALKANTWLDTMNMGVAMALQAIPIFIVAILLQFLIIWVDKQTGIGWPVSTWGHPWSYSWEDLRFKIAPIIAFAGTGLANYARLARTSMLEVLRQDYIRTARAKGLVERVVIMRHALRTALIPLVTAIGVAIGFLVSGAFFTERIFQIQGIAGITTNSILTLDYPVVQATVVILAIGVIIGNLISDVLYSVVDPRIKAE